MTTEEAIARIKDHIAVHKYLERGAIHIIEALDMATKALEREQWIPSGERLPDEEGWYLVTDDSGGVQWIEAIYYTPGDGLEPFWSVQNPIAWMRCPNPYRR